MVLIAISIPGEKNSFTSEEILIVCEELNIICYRKSLQLLMLTIFLL